MIIYLDWLPLPKEQFKILMYLLDSRSSSFSIESIIKFLMRNKKEELNKDDRRYWIPIVRKALSGLSQKDLISYQIRGEEIKVSVLPKDEYIQLNSNTLKISDFTRRGFCQSADWAVVLKVLFAIMSVGNNYNVDTIVAITSVGKKQVSRSASVLKNDFTGVVYKRHTRFIQGNWLTEYISLDISAFGFERK